jgi:hypothetical protein
MKLSKKYKKFYEKEMKKLNKMKRMISRHHQHQQQQIQNTTSTSGSKHAYKLPVLTRIEMLREEATAASQTIFNDYLLVPSKTKFKHLLVELFDQVKLDANNDKSNLKIVDGNF